MTGPLVRWPAGPITPAGRAWLRTGKLPMMSYLSPDHTVVFNLVGPLAIFDRTMPERVQLRGLKGLISPWENIEQKGATQDGSTYVASLYDPIDIELTVLVCGRDPSNTRAVLRSWIDSWDAKTAGRLSWRTFELGEWWADVRFDKAPLDAIMGGLWIRQKFTWKAKAYNAFWQSYDSTDSFSLPFMQFGDTFSTDYSSADNLGPNWDLAYSGGTGSIYANGSAVVCNLTAGETAVARNHNQTTTDYQVVTITLGALTSNFMCVGSNDVWLRMNNTGTPGTDGVRLRISDYHIRLSYFIGGTETVIRQRPMLLCLKPNDQITVTCGIGGNPRAYLVQYGRANTVLGYFDDQINALSGGAITNPFPRSTVTTLMQAVETGSLVDSSHRSGGFGMYEDTSGEMPAQLKTWTLADASPDGNGPANTGWGFLTRCNAGDQPMWDRFTLIGPGTFYLGNGPNSSDYITMGPLLANQVVQVPADPRKRNVIDLSSVPTTAPPQQVGLFQQAWKDLISMLSNGLTATPPVASVFGVVPPQGNLYSLLHGRFSNPIPPKPAGAPAPKYQVSVGITGGSPASAIMVAGTPLRRFPQ